MSKFCIAILLLYSTIGHTQSKIKIPKLKQEYIAVRVYHFSDQQQANTIDLYLQSSLLPSLEKQGFSSVGFFEAIANDTAKDKTLYVFIPLSTLEKLQVVNDVFNKSLSDSMNAQEYVHAVYNHPAYTRFETFLLYTFMARPQVKPSVFKGNHESVYELRSYESASEALHQNKVKMFNSGEEDIFDRLEFHPVFFSQVIAGSRMPNLVYMTSFESKASRDEHWKKFSSDPDWKSLSSKPEYQNNVSKIDIVFLRPLSYSRL